MVDSGYDEVLLSVEVLFNEILGLVEGSDHVHSIDCLLDMGNQRSSGVSFNSFDLSRRFHVETDQVVVNKPGKHSNY